MLPPVVHLTREMLQSPTFHYHVNVPTAIERLKQGRPPLPTVEELAEQQRQRDLEQQQTQSRRTRRPDDEYDMEDPFIDDQDAPNRGQYESVLLPLLSHDADGHNDEEEGGGAKANWTGDVNFYVYRGPLEVDVIEKEFEEKRSSKKKRKRPKKTGKKATPRADSPALFSSKRPSPPQQSKEDGPARKEDGNVKPRRKKPRMDKEKQPTGKQIREKANLTDQLGQMLAKVGQGTEQASPAKSLAQPSTPKQTKAKKPKPADNSPLHHSHPDRHRSHGPHGASSVPEGEVAMAWCEYQDALMDFGQGASVIGTFDAAKFPHQLRRQLEQVLLAYLRLPPASYSLPDNDDLDGDDDKTDKRDSKKCVSEDVWQEVALRVPYQPTALRKLAVKKVIPALLSDTLNEANSLQAVLNEARLCLHHHSNKKHAVDKKDAASIADIQAAEEEEALMSDAMTQPPQSESAPEGLDLLKKFSEPLKQAIYGHCRLCLHRSLLQEALKVWDTSDPAPDMSMERRQMYAVVDPAQIRRRCFADIVERGEGLINGGVLSKAFSAYKRRLQGQILRRHKVKLTADSAKKRASPKKNDSGRSDGRELAAELFDDNTMDIVDSKKIDGDLTDDGPEAGQSSLQPEIGSTLPPSQHEDKAEAHEQGRREEEGETLPSSFSEYTAAN